MPRLEGEVLFSTYDFHAIQQDQSERLKDAINRADAASVEAGTVEEAAERFAAQFRFEVPELTEGAFSVDVEEAQVDVSGDPMRGRRFDGGRSYVPGIRATYFVPFQGHKDLFRCRPNRFTSVVPFAVLADSELQFQFERGDQNVGETKSAFDEEVSHVNQYLGWLRENASTYNVSLSALARERVTARRARLEELQRGTNALGIPIRRASVTSPPASRIETTTRAVPSTRRASGSPPDLYDVALTFAGEDRTYVEEVATALKAAGVKVFYDYFEQANLWGKNLVDHLADIYQNKTRYVVMFISAHYVEKAWPQHERQNAQARSLLAKGEYILPVRFDDTEVPGLTGTVGHLDLRKISRQNLVDLILQKLRKTSSS